MPYDWIWLFICHRQELDEMQCEHSGAVYIHYFPTINFIKWSTPQNSYVTRCICEISIEEMKHSWLDIGRNSTKLVKHGRTHSTSVVLWQQRFYLLYHPNTVLKGLFQWFTGWQFSDEVQISSIVARGVGWKHDWYRQSICFQALNEFVPLSGLIWGELVQYKVFTILPLL